MGIHTYLKDIVDDIIRTNRYTGTGVYRSTIIYKNKNVIGISINRKEFREYVQRSTGKKVTWTTIRSPLNRGGYMNVTVGKPHTIINIKAFDRRIKIDRLYTTYICNTTTIDAPIEGPKSPASTVKSLLDLLGAPYNPENCKIVCDWLLLQ
jgi:hypothetical protein